MLNKDGQRALAYVVEIHEVRPLEGYDRVEYARTSGWWCIVSKEDNFKPGDKAIYFEVDSLCPSDDERFAFLAKRKYRIKTQKMCKVISQGLIMPLSLFPEIEDTVQVGHDLTEFLGVKYYEPEDNIRKSKGGDPNAKYKSMSARHKNLAHRKWWRWLMKRQWGRDLLFVFFGKKKDNPLRFPTHFPLISKTDEERVENMPWILENKEPWIKTQKIDGTSSTYILEKKGRKYEYYVCSRNIRQRDRDQKNYHNDVSGVEDNVYWQMSDKYKIYNFLKEILDADNLKYICLQGETAGPSLQGNPHGFEEVCFFGFNLIRSDTGRMNSVKAAAICLEHGIPWVPIVDENYILPDDFEEFKLSADGPCEVGNGLREGYVYRSQDGLYSFKNVSREYLLKKG